MVLEYKHFNATHSLTVPRALKCNCCLASSLSTSSEVSSRFLEGDHQFLLLCQRYCQYQIQWIEKDSLNQVMKHLLKSMT